MNENPDVPGFIQRFHPTFPVGVINNMAVWGYMQFSVAMRPPYVPYMVFIDRVGMIRSQYTGTDAILADEPSMDKGIRAEVVKLLSEGSKTSAKSPVKRAAVHKK
jgi:hypothetical protein